jgi:hypothetical protein
VVKLLGNPPLPGGLHGKLIQLTEGNNNNSRYVGLLGNLLLRFKDDLYHDSFKDLASSSAAGVRFHYADIRYDANIRGLLPSRKSATTHEHVTTSDGLRALLHAFMFGTDFVADVNACCRTAKVLPGSLSSLEPNGPRLHRVSKQFHRLPEGRAKHAVRSYLSSRVEELIFIMHHDVGLDQSKHTLQPVTPGPAGYEPWLSKIRAVHADYHVFAYHDAMHLGVWVLLMDAYLLCRLLRFAAPGGSTIVYVGDAHAYFLTRFFRDYMGLQPTQDFAANSKRSRGGRERRCVDVRNHNLQPQQPAITRRATRGKRTV